MADEKDLIIGGEEPTGEESEFYEEYPDLHAEIASATNALAAIEGLDLAMMPKRYTPMIQTIRRKSIAIIAKNINDIHDEVFGREEDKEEEED